MSDVEELVGWFLAQSGKVNRAEYYGRDGMPQTAKEWTSDFANPEMKRVKLTNLPWGGFVSTVWLGLDHSSGDGPPLIFETMVFPKGSYTELDMDRYTTESEALAGHERMVAKWQKDLRPHE